MSAQANPGRLRSLRWRLLATVCAAVLLLWLLTGLFSYMQAQDEAEELMDGSLAQTARLLLAIVRDNEAELADLANRLATVRGAADNIYEPPLEFQLGRGDGSILARSVNAPRLPILGVTDYGDIIRANESWRVLNVASADGRYRVQVSQSIGLRDRAALEVAGQTIVPLTVILPALLLLIYLSIRGGLRPLDRLAAEVSARTPENLAALPADHIPTEVRPLVDAINRLFARVGSTLENERRFTADAAHELRTPLAALKVQTQVALLSTDAPMRDHALRQIGIGVDRASHLVDQLLRLARLDPLQCPANPEPLDLSALVREVLDSVRSANPEPDCRIGETLPAGGPFLFGDRDLLRIALRNLVDNAMRYTRPGDWICIELGASGDALSLTVRDSGPGVPAAVQARLGERFYRGRDNHTEGNGLGLAIVTRIVELHGARFSVGNHPDGGFVARIEGLKRLPSRGAEAPPAPVATLPDGR